MQEVSGFDEIVERFTAIATEFCGVVDTAATLDRVAFLKQVYRLLPKLIDQAISFPDVELSDNENADGEEDVAQNHGAWKARFALLSEKLDDWDFYPEVLDPVFDPLRDTEVVLGSLADDLADIHRDLSEALSDPSMLPQNRIWTWQFSFRTHWGQHAVDALKTIHVRLQA